MAGLSLLDVEKSYGKVAAVRRVSFDVEAGRLGVLVGPSGCGKTTTLRLIAGLTAADLGRIFIAGEEISSLPPHRRGVAMVFQSPALYPHLSIAGNLGFALRMRGGEPREIARRVQNAARLLGLESLLDRRPEELSGGEQQRVALGKAIVQQPRLWLLDEPLASLDAPLRRQLGQEIVRIQRETRTTTLLVTHDQEEALTLADWLIVMHDGRVQQTGPPDEVYARPVNRFVATFLGDPPMNVIRGHVDAGVFHAPGFSLTVPSELPDGLLDLAFRPEAVRISPVASDEASQGTVQRVEHLEFRGHAVIARVRIGEQVVSVRPRPDPPLAVGENVGLVIPPDDCHYFAATDEGERVG